MGNKIIMWVLALNDMRSPKGETLDHIVKAETKEALVAFLESEKVEIYYDGPWAKSYRAGGLLEWKNPSVNKNQGIYNIGTRNEWMQKAAIEAGELFDKDIAPLPTI